MGRLALYEIKSWSENPYEGEVKVELAGSLLWCRVVANESEWPRLAVRTWVEGTVTFQRYGDMQVLAPTAPRIELLAGISYRITGTIRRIDGELVILDGLDWLVVDLDLPPDRRSPAGQVGAGLQVVGRFELDLEPV